MHALAQSRTRRSLMIIIGFALALAGVIAARYALLALIWHHTAMHFHGYPHLARVLADPLMHYFG